MAIVSKRYTLLYSAFFAVFALFGTSITIVGATLPKILADFNWNYKTAGIVMAAGAIGYFLSTLIAGRLLGRIGPRASIALGLLLDTVGLAFFAANPSPAFNLVMYLAVGLGQGFIEVAIDWSVLQMESGHSGRAMSLMHGAFAIGAVVGPFILGWLIQAQLPWVALYRGIALLFGLLLASTFFLPIGLLGSAAGSVSPPEHASDSADSRKTGRTERHPAYWLGFTALLLYVGVELGISNWVSEFFVSVFGASPAVGSFMVSLFWTGLVAGRFGLPLLARNIRQSVILMAISSILVVSSAALALLGFIGPDLRLIAYVFVLLAGFGCSSIYPIVVSIAGSTFPEAQAKAIGIASAGGGLGSFIFPYFMSIIAAGLGIRLGFAIYAVFAIASLVACKALVSASQKHSGRRI